MTTKEQERKALAQIEKIVSALGEDSYIKTAFAGCFEDARENIESDAAFSMKDRYEFAEREARLQRERAEEAEAKAAELEALRGACLKRGEWIDFWNIAQCYINDRTDEAEAEAAVILANAEHPETDTFRVAVANRAELLKKIENGQEVLKRISEMEEARAIARV